MPSKIVSLMEAVRAVPDGSTVALGGNTIHRSPCAAIHEMIRQGKKGLTLVKTAGAYDVDVLCGTGVTDAVLAAYVGFENFGLAPRFRRAVESGRVKLHEHTWASVHAGLRAAVQGVPFMPLKGLLNSGLVEAQGFRKVTDPYAGGDVVVIPAIICDWAVVHVHECDEGGNAFMDGSRYDDVLLMRAAKKVLVTCEKIVPAQKFVESPRRADFPGFSVDAVVEVPEGARPTSCGRLYPYDREFLIAYLQAAADEGKYRAFLEDHVYG